MADQNDRQDKGRSPAPQQDDNLDDKGRDINSGETDPERHPQAGFDKDEADDRRR